MKCNNSPLVYLLVLNYKGFSDTCMCIESLLEIDYDNYEIVIIDNDSQDGSYEKLQMKYPELKVIQTGRNLGYAGGNNIGIKYAIDMHADYIGILNNDIKVEKNFLQILISEMQNNSNLAIAGPCICEWDSNIIQSAGALINFYTAESKNLFTECEYSIIEEKKIACDYVGGACLIVRASLIEKIGLIPEEYFLYFEETEWCIKTKKMGYEVCCLPNARIWHKESASLEDVSQMKQFFLDRNRVYFVKKNGKKVHFLVFLCYAILQMIYRKITKKNSTAGIKAISAGIQGRMGGYICESNISV